MAGRLVERLAAELGLAPKPVSPRAMEALRRHAWPGNVRELSNALERAAVSPSASAAGDVVRGGRSPGWRRRISVRRLYSRLKDLGIR